MYQVPLEELLLSSLLSIKRVGSNRLTNLPKESFSLSEELTRGAPSRCDRIKLKLYSAPADWVHLIFHGPSVRRKIGVRNPAYGGGVNSCLVFSQGLLHKDYLLHL